VPLGQGADAPDKRANAPGPWMPVASLRSLYLKILQALCFTMPGRRENMPEGTLEVKDTVVHASSSKFIA